METNLIDEERYRERIDYFRSQVDIDTRDVWMYMFKKHPHMLDFHRERVGEFLNENLDPKRLIADPKR